MTIETQLFTTLNGLVGGRMYPLVAPNSPTTPLLVYLNVANSPEVTLADGSPINNTRMQIDVYETTYAAVKALAAQVIAAMAGATFTNVPLQQQDLYEDAVKLYRVQMDFSIWY
jgi:hypothetical protein